MSEMLVNGVIGALLNKKYNKNGEVFNGKTPFFVKIKFILFSNKNASL